MVRLTGQLVSTTQELVELYRRQIAQHGFTAPAMFYRSQEQHELKLSAVAKMLREADVDKARSVLDVGCGYGRLLDFIEIDPHRYVGVDLVEAFVAKARESYPGFKFFRRDLTDGFAHLFDIVVLAGVLSSVPNPAELLNAALAGARQYVIFDVVRNERLPASFRDLNRLSMDETRQALLDGGFSEIVTLEAGASWTLLKARKTPE